MKPEEVDGAVDFDVPFRVTNDGRIVSDIPGHYAPSLYDETLDSDAWEFWSTGRSGQYGYSGPIMHDSEYLGGGMARDLLAEPGIYAVVAAYWSPDDEDSEIEGWAVVKYVGPHKGHFSRLGGQWWCDTCNSPYCEEA